MPRKILFWIFLTTVLLAPLPFASNRPWSWSLLCLIIGSLLIIEGIFSLFQKEENSTFLRRIWPGLVLWFVVVTWIVIQSMTGMSPDFAHPMFTETELLLGQQSASSISLDSQATLTALMRLLTYGGVFWLSTRFFSNVEYAALALKAFVIISAIYAIYGLIVFFSGSGTILWFDKWAYHENLTSTFVNRNTYATFAGLGLLASTVLLFQSAKRHLSNAMNVRELFQSFVERVFSRAWLPVGTMLLTATALLLTHSRGGLLSTAIALFVMVVILSLIHIIPKKISLGFMALTFMGSVFAFSLSGDIVANRLQNTSFETSMRDEVYIRTIDAITTDPFVGSGYGTFQKAFRPFKTYYLMPFNWDKAHNSYLELAMEIGVPATILLILSFFWLMGVYTYGLFKRNRRKEYAVLGLSATFLVGVHSLVDFSLQIPGLTVTYALIAGMGWSQSWPSQRHRRDEPSPVKNS